MVIGEPNKRVNPIFPQKLSSLNVSLGELNARYNATGKKKLFNFYEAMYISDLRKNSLVLGRNPVTYKKRKIT